jgi:precorrin-3B synthase
VPNTRTRRDRCPGALRPWPADDGLLVRLRLVGGRLPVASLLALLEVAESYGDGRVHVTGRANLQLRALPSRDGVLPPEVLAALSATGLLPSRSHELVRNVMVSPATGRYGGRADLGPVADDLDHGLCADPGLAALPGRFLFVLDDGRGDLVDRVCDLGLVALDGATAQLRIGPGWGGVVGLAEASSCLLDLSRAFLERRGRGAHVPWHVSELPTPLVPALPRDARVPAAGAPMPFGRVPEGVHAEVSVDGLDRSALIWLPDPPAEVVVTPWRGILVPRGRP